MRVWAVLLISFLSCFRFVGAQEILSIKPLSEQAEAAYFQPKPGVRDPLKLNQANVIEAGSFDPKEAKIIFTKDGFLDRVLPYDELFLKSGFPGDFDKLERTYQLELPLDPPDAKVYEVGRSSNSKDGQFLGTANESPTIDRSNFYDSARGLFQTVRLKFTRPGYLEQRLEVSAKELIPGKRWDPIVLQPAPGFQNKLIRAQAWLRQLNGVSVLGFLLSLAGIGALVVRTLRRQQRSQPRVPVEKDEVGCYELLESIGRGSTAEVFKVVSKDDPGALPMALKLTHESSIDTQGRERFLREVKSSLELDHPALAKVYDWGERTDGRLYMVCELLVGETLRTRLSGGKRLDPSNVSKIVKDLGGALSHLHQRGLVHRDVKPDNIFLTADGGAKLVDLGLLRGNEDILTHTGVVLGTPAYMPPEQINGKPVPASDQYALGFTCFECLTGQRPYHAQDLVELIHKQVTAPVPRLRDVDPDGGEFLESVLTRMMDKDPEKRFPDVAKAVEALLEALENQGDGLETTAF